MSNLQVMEQAQTTLDESAVRGAGELIAAEIHALEVVDDPSFQRAAALSRRLAHWLKEAHEFFDPICDSAHKAWKTATERRKSVIEPRELLKVTLGERMAAYEEEQERKRLAAEAEREREQARLEAEAREMAEAEAREQKLLAEEELLERAAEADARGDDEAVSRILATEVATPYVPPMPVFVPPVQVQRPSAAGISFATTWSAEVTSLAELVQAVARGEQPITLLQPNMVALNGMARSLRGAMKIPGVKAVPKRGAATRTV